MAVRRGMTIAVVIGPGHVDDGLLLVAVRLDGEDALHGVALDELALLAGESIRKTKADLTKGQKPAK